LKCDASAGATFLQMTKRNFSLMAKYEGFFNIEGHLNCKDIKCEKWWILKMILSISPFTDKIGYFSTFRGIYLLLQNGESKTRLFKMRRFIKISLQIMEMQSSKGLFLNPY